jgi:predicted RNase H-like HicB family nuclease/predicted DNA binding CopG/RHH family protein
MAEYIAFIHKDAGSDFGASFPDFPGAVTAAATLEELRGQAEEVLALHIEGMVEDGEPIPDPATLDVAAQHPDYRDAVAILAVHAPEKSAATVRVNITLPEPMLKRIDRQAAKHGLTRSTFLVRAAMQKIDAET